MIDYELAQKVVDLQTSIHAADPADPAALSALLATRVPCNRVLADHPTVQVGQAVDGFEVGLLGVLSGLCGVWPDGWGAVAVIVEEDGSVTGVQIEGRYRPTLRRTGL